MSHKHRSFVQVYFAERQEHLLSPPCQNFGFLLFHGAGFLNCRQNCSFPFSSSHAIFVPSFACRRICEVLWGAASKAMLRRRCPPLWRVSLLRRTCFLLLRDVFSHLVYVILSTSNSSSFALCLFYLTGKKNCLTQGQPGAFQQETFTTLRCRCLLN